MQSTLMRSSVIISTLAIALTFQLTRHPKSQAGFETNSVWQGLRSDG
ncbi:MULTISPECIES: hypothetical protein [Microcoleaceae]